MHYARNNVIHIKRLALVRRSCGFEKLLPFVFPHVLSPLTQKTFSHIQGIPPSAASHTIVTCMHTSDHVRETSAICPHSITRYHIARRSYLTPASP